MRVVFRNSLEHINDCLPFVPLAVHKQAFQLLDDVRGASGQDSLVRQFAFRVACDERREIFFRVVQADSNSGKPFQVGE